MTINCIIIEVDEAYVNYVDTLGSKMYTTSSIESVESINRKARIVEAPNFTILKKGDEVIVHHNILRLRYGMQGSTIKSNYHYKDNLYFVPLTEIFMFKRGDNEWEALDPFCFIKPIKYENKKVGNLLIYDNTTGSHKDKVKNIGEVKFLNKEMKAAGISIGDKIVFSNNSEYEFNINGEILYKMSTRDILAKI